MTEEQNQQQVDQTVTAITQIIASVSAEEESLATMIQALAMEVNAVVGTNPTNILTLTNVDNSVKRKLRTILKKNIVLEKKLRDAVDFLQRLVPVTGTELQNLVNALTSILVFVGGEEAALGSLIRAEANKINFVANDFGDSDTFSNADLVTINNNAETVVSVILDKNIVLENKVVDVLRGFNFLGVDTTSPTFGAQIKLGLAAVISSVAQEEQAFATLINAEVNKLNSIVSDVNEGEATFTELITVNNSIENMLQTILMKNIALETKLEEVLEFFS